MRTPTLSPASSNETTGATPWRTVKDAADGADPIGSSTNAMLRASVSTTGLQPPMRICTRSPGSKLNDIVDATNNYSCRQIL